MKSSKYIAIIVAILAVLWVGSGFISSESSAPLFEATTAEKKLLNVRVRESHAQSYEDSVEITGRSHASQKVILKTETSGSLITLLKEEGDTVTAGEALAEIELGDRGARVQETRERVNQRRMEYNVAKNLQNKGFNSKVKLAQTLADLEDAKAALKEAEIDRTKTRIKAPFDGVIAQQSVEVGDYLAIGDALFTVVNLNPIEFVGFVSERNIAEIKIGDNAKALLLDGNIIEVIVSYIAPAANEQTRTFRIVLSAPNEDFSIKEGLTATVSISTAQKQAHKISPSILSLNDDGEIGVKTVNNENRVVFTPVSVLADTTEAMWVLGLSDTARIITVGQEFVSEGQIVNPVLSGAEGLL